MPQAVKRYYGSANAANTWNYIYTCPSSTIAKVIVNGLILQNGYLLQHTAVSTDSTYKLLGQTSSSRAVWEPDGQGRIIDKNNSSSSDRETYPIVQYGAEQTNRIGYTSGAMNGTNFSTAGSNTMLVTYSSEWYISASQQLIIRTNNYTCAWDFTIIEEAGSGT